MIHFSASLNHPAITVRGLIVVTVTRSRPAKSPSWARKNAPLDCRCTVYKLENKEMHPLMWTNTCICTHTHTYRHTHTLTSTGTHTYRHTHTVTADINMCRPLCVTSLWHDKWPNQTRNETPHIRLLLLHYVCMSVYTCVCACVSAQNLNQNHRWPGVSLSLLGFDKSR